MSDLYNVTFKGGATSDLIEEFNERKKYQNYPGFEKYKTVDTFFKDFNYGILNKDYYPVSLIVDNPQQQLQNFPDFAEEVFVLPFVAKAFEDLRKDYVYFIENSPENVQQAIALGFVNPNENFGLLSYPKYLENLAPVNGYLNFEEEYANYLNFNMIEYLNILNTSTELAPTLNAASPPSQETVGRNFRVFMGVFMKLFQERARKFPLTKSGFSTSRHCSIMTTGLCIELTDLDYNVDGPKGEMITNSDFECFADYANHYGFMIDKNAPWRLVADLDSEVMKNYIVQGHNKSPEQAIEYFDAYARTKNHLDDVYALDTFLTRLFVTLYGRPNLVYLVSSEEYRDRKYWINILFQSRMLELGAPMDTENERKRQEILDILDIPGLGFNYAIQKIGLICSQKLREIYGPN